MQQRFFVWLALGALLLPCATTADESPEAFEWGAVVTGVGQAGDYKDAFSDNGQPIGNPARGSLAADINIGFKPTPQDELFALVSIAKGNGLQGLGGVSLQVNADDLEDDLKHVSGWGWSYVLQSWYRHQWQMEGDSSLALTAGIVDGSDYLDTNAFANDEIGQFMNSAFVAEEYVPSHNPGIVLEYRSGDTTLSAVWNLLLTAPRNEGGHTYSYGGIQLAQRVDTPWGEGNYRLILEGTAKSLPAQDQMGNTRELSAGLSMDQKLGEIFGVFARVGIANDGPAQIVHDRLFSLGANINGRWWGRADDEVGIAYAYLGGAGDQPGDIDHTQAFESYLRLALTERSNLTLDVQWVRDWLQQSPESPRTWVGGVRLNLAF